jgi:hypothetical protein
MISFTSGLSKPARQAREKRWHIIQQAGKNERNSSLNSDIRNFS